MGKMFDNVRAWWNDLADRMSDPAKLANLKVADLEDALKKAKSEAAIIVGRPATLRREVATLKKQESDYVTKISRLVEAAKNGNADAEDLARKHASKLGEIRTTLASKEAELEEAEVSSKEWADRIDTLEAVLRQKRVQSQQIAARSKMAKAETKLGEAMNDLGGLNDDSFSKLEAKVQMQEQKAAGFSQMNGVNDAMKEREIMRNAEADSILKEFGL